MPTSQDILAKLSQGASSPDPLAPDPTKGEKLSAKDAQNLAIWVREQYDAAKSERSETQIQWGMNMVMFRGKQNMQWLDKSKRFSNLPAAPWRVRHITNKIRPMVRNEIARLTSQKPTAVVVPASSEDEDLFAAQAGEQAWEYLYNRKKLTAVHRNMTFWRQICGTAFIKTWWDQSKTDGKAQGDICFGAVTPFHLYVPDIREVEIEDQPFVINVYTRSVDNLTAMFPGRFRNAPQPTVASQSDIIDDAYMDTSNAGQKPNACMVYEVWIKPGGHPMFPQGGMLTVVDQQVVEFSNDGLPYQHGEYPFTKFDHIPSGKFYADSSITDVIALQKEYNRTRSQIIEAKNRTAKPKFLYQRGSLDPTKINTEAGQFIPYKMGYDRPTPLPPVELPSYIFNDLERTIADFEDLTGQHAVSKGGTPPGVTAATAINYLQERDDAYLTHTYQSDEEGWQKLGRQALSHMVQYWDVPRLVKVTGTDGAFDAVLLKGSDIASGTDLRIEGGSSMPTSKAAKQAFLMDLMKMQFIPPEKGLELMDVGGVNQLYDDVKVDQRQAQRENLKLRGLSDEEVKAFEDAQVMAAQAVPAPSMDGLGGPEGLPPEIGGDLSGGMGGDIPADPLAPNVNALDGAPMGEIAIVPVNSWDNHAIHIEIHNKFRKGQTYELLSDPIKRQFELHVAQHEAALVGQQMGMQGGMGGSMEMPPGPAPESGGGENQFTSTGPMEG